VAEVLRDLVGPEFCAIGRVRGWPQNAAGEQIIDLMVLRAESARGGQLLPQFLGDIGMSREALGLGGEVAFGLGVENLAEGARDLGLPSVTAVLRLIARPSPPC